MSAKEIVSRRWPAVASWIASSPSVPSELRRDVPFETLSLGGVQLESAHDPRAEAGLQATLIPDEARSATLYGFAQGTLARILLRRPALERLRVVILNPALARESLRCFDHSDWLGDTRVELVRACARDELEVPFAAAPACLRLAADEAARVRDLVRLELATPHVRRHLRARTAERETRLRANEALLRHDGDVAELFDSHGGATLRVAAAGPSLEQHFGHLRAGGAPLIAVDAALGPLVRAGIRPDIVVTVDDHAEGPRRLLALPDAALDRSVLVYFPVVANDALQCWPGRRLAAYPPGDVFADTRARFPKAELWSSGSVIHPAVDLAVRMGAGRVELYGADFAIPDGKSHVSGSAWERSYEIGPDTPWVLDGYGRRIPSFANLIGYLRDLERYIESHPEVGFVNTSRAGAAIAGTLPPGEARAA